MYRSGINGKRNRAVLAPALLRAANPSRAGACIIALALAASGGLVALGLGAIPARAEINYPVCLRVYGSPTYSECRYTSIAQCKMSASGRSADCYVDPFYTPNPSPPPPARSRRSGRAPHEMGY